MPASDSSFALVDGDSNTADWQQRLLRLGLWRLVGLTTLASIGISVAVSWGSHWILVGGFPTAGWVIAILVPLVVAPLASYFGFKLMFEMAHMRAQLRELAIRDSLTRTYNRRYFMTRLAAEVARERREGQLLTVLMIDVDHFKAINDTHGHATGDQVLEQLAQVLLAAMRPYDLVARYGGEEFVALMPSTTLEQACMIGERVRDAIATMVINVQPSGEPLSVTASIGVSGLDDGEPDGTAMLMRADSAMYDAKRGGRNRCVVLSNRFEPEAS
jgi:diguanylate cyclase (GGDEF)-like protein